VGLFVAAAIMLLAPAAATAASPVLEYELPAGAPPVTFTAEGGETIAQMVGFESVVHCAASHAEGEITGPRSTVSKYSFTGCKTQGGAQKCKSEGALEEEITTGPIEAELVWIDQARHEVGELLAPHGGTYIAFDCGGETAEGRGPFLATITPINSAVTSFTATLSQSASVQTPNQYEGTEGELLQAIPLGKHGSSELVPTGVESTILVHPSVAVEIKAITAQEVEAKQREEQEARQREQKQREEAEALAAAAAKKRQEEAAAKKRQEEAVIAAAAKKRQEEAARAARRRHLKITVLKVRVVRHRLVFSLRLSTAGVVSVSGRSLRKTSKALRSGARRLAVPILQTAHSNTRHRAARVTVSLRAPSGTVSRTLTLRL
jgi:hypothetical protein